MNTITNAEFREIAENAISYLYDNDLLEDFLEDRGIELDKDKREYFGIEETTMTKNTNPCWNCGYHWQENWESFPSCHYEGPSAWAPCEAEETAKIDELERLEYEEEIRAMCEEEEEYDAES